MMNLQKFRHACFAVTKDDATLIVDPGNWSTDIGDLTNVIAIVITHEHADHFDHTQLQKLSSTFPQATVYAHHDITSQITELPTHAVTAGDTRQVGPFTLSFYGGTHAVIHSSLPVVANLGVLINHSLYYPGDSLTIPHVPVTTLALPAAAPWMKISETIDFCTAINASVLVFPTHDAILSDDGKALIDKMISTVSPVYQRIDGSLTITD